jgi:hypothetical protein
MLLRMSVSVAYRFLFHEFERSLKATFDSMRHAVVKLVTEEASACSFHRAITSSLRGVEAQQPTIDGEVPGHFNESQRQAILASRDAHLSLVWGPPGANQ